MGTKYGGAVTIWSSNLNHAVGDYPGEATKVVAGAGVIAAGFIPGDIYAPTAEETNNELNYYSKILAWVQEGSSANGVDTHIVETNATGDISVRRGLFFTDGGGLSAIVAEATGGGSGVYGKSNSNGVTGEAVFGGSGYGVRGFASSNSGGVRGQGSGVGYGGYFTAGSTGVGVRAEGGGSGGAGLEAVGDGGAPDIDLFPFENWGIDIACFPTALGGIRISANGQLGLSVLQNDPNANAVTFLGDGAAAAGVETLEVRAFGAGDAIQAYATTGTGYPLVLSPKVAAASKGALLFGGQSSRPSSVDSGQQAYLSSEGQFAHSDFSDNGWRGFWSSPGGYAAASSVQPNLGYGPAFFGLNGAYQTVGEATAAAGDAPKVAGRPVRMRLSFSYMCAADTLVRLDLIVRDTTAVGDPTRLTRAGAGQAVTAGYYLASEPITGWRPPMMIEFQVPIPTAGARTWDVQMKSTDLVNVRDVMLVCLGQT